MLEEFEFQDQIEEIAPVKPQQKLTTQKSSGGLLGDFQFILDIYINDGGESDIDGDFYGNEKNPYMSYGSVAEEDFLELAMHEATTSGLQPVV